MSAVTGVVAVVVLYQPPAEVTQRLARMVRTGLPVVAVYNQSPGGAAQALHEATGAHVVPFARNIGLASAINAGIAEARRLGASSVFLLDQDSDPAPDLHAALLAVLHEAQRSGLKVAAIGPRLLDVKSSHRARDTGGLGVQDGLEKRWEQRSSIITSGSIVPLAALDAIGPMWDELFIDDIDHEWCLRARHLEWAVLEATSLRILHNLGDRGINLFGYFKAVHRAPVRHYYILRNTLALLSIRQIPLSWRLSEGLKSLYRVPIYLLVSSCRKQSAISMLSALRDHRQLLKSKPQAWN